MRDTPDKSPRLLPGRPKRDATGRRLNSLPMIGLGVLGGCAAVAIVIAGVQRYHGFAGTGAAEATTKPVSASADDLLAGAPRGAIRQAAARPSATPAVQHRPAVSGPPPESKPAPATAPAQTTPTENGGEANSPDFLIRKEAWDAYVAQVAQLRDQRFAAARAALVADQVVPGGGATALGGGAGGVPGGGQLTIGSPGADQGDRAREGGATAAAPIVDARGQREKQAFISQSGDLSGESDHLAAHVEHGDPFTVPQGSFIPAVLLTKINSDVPGHIVAMVTSPVFGNYKGHDPLIPSRSFLYGQYDNAVTAGQSRLAVIWHRIRFPNGDSLNIGAMEGTDQGGAAGFHDLVDTHIWSKIGTAALISIAGAGAQLSQPAQPVYGTYSPTSIASAAIGQQFAQLGQEYARSGLSIPNTVSIRPGFRFNVLVTRDIGPLQPYRGGGEQPTPADFAEDR